MRLFRLLVPAFVLVFLWGARPADACGGFFCSSLPIDQSAEHIAFGVTRDASGNTTVETHVQISYTGSAHSFAWVVPVHARPTLDVGTDALFTALDNATRPTFTLQYDDSRCMPPVPESAYDGAGGGADAGTSHGVTVVSQEDVGPYVATILTATDATEMTLWLQNNGYDLTEQGAAALQPYVGQGYFFVALKLQANRDIGDLKPIVLKMTDTTPCIPIKLTAIAASQNMPIVAYFFSSGRGIPTNYRHVIINEQAIDWLNYGSNYGTVATQAVNEAGGHAFLTEYAGPTKQLVDSGLSLYATGRYDTTALAAIADPVDFVQRLISDNYPRSGLLALLERFIPEPASLTGTVPETVFYSNLQQYRDAIANDPGRDPFDAAGLAAAIETEIVTPLKNAQGLLDGAAYTTRLFTTMSPAEMTVDPEFDFNTELGDVSNVHVAHATCDANNSNSSIEIRLTDGRTFSVNRGGSPPRVPAAGIVEQLSPQGQPVELVNNVRVSPRSFGCQCGSADPIGWVLALGMMVLRRRRT